LLFGATAIAAVVVMGAAGGTATAAAIKAAPEAPCGAVTDSTYLSTSLAVALRIAHGERQGAAVSRAVRTIEADRVLANAVAADDLTAVRSEVLVLIHNGQHIVRLRVLRNGQLLDDFGGPLVLAPVSGLLTVNGRVVGTFVMSLQDDVGYQKLLERLVGADTVMAYQGQTIVSDIAVGSSPLPPQGTVVVGNLSYLTASFTAGHFPSGELSVTMLLPRPQASLAGQSCAQVAADVLAGVAQRIYGEALTSQYWIGRALASLSRSAALGVALGAGDDAGVRQIVRSLVGAGGFERLRVVNGGGRVVADTGTTVPLLAPLTRPLVDAAGRLVGEAMFAVETAPGYEGLARSLVFVPVLVRVGAQQLAGTFAGPPALPASGQISYLGRSYAVASFPVVEFPSVQARIYVLEPE